METHDVKEKILVVEDDRRLWGLFPRVFRKEGWEFSFSASAEEAMETVKKPGVIDELAVALVDISLPGASGLDFLRWMHELDAGIPVVMLTSTADAKTAVTCMKAGALDFVTKPFSNQDLAQTLIRAIATRRLICPHPRILLDEPMASLMGPSDKIRELIRHVHQVSPTNLSVLIVGESGTGKEIVANRIHALSGHSQGPFIAVDCGAIPENLIESELFGFKKGSFTGAVGDQEGKIRAASGGSLFLDEIENLSPATQIKLLRVLQERRVTPVGASTPVSVDVRLISATNTPLNAKIAAGEFRLDLFHRISEFPLSIPPLSERPDDILYLTMRFLREAYEEFGKEFRGLGQDIIDQLLEHRWTGNVRELRNVIRRAVLVNQGTISTLWPDDASQNEQRDSTLVTADGQIVIRAHAVISDESIHHGNVPFKQIRDRLMGQIEREILKAVLERLSGNRLQASKVLGLDYKTVHTKAKGLIEGRLTRSKVNEEL